MKQSEALDILKLGYNLFLTGPPGSGKTFLLKKYINYLRKNNKQVAITASTGIAATHMGGMTIHSWTGMGIKESISENEMRKLLKKPYLRKRFENIGVLIIDEISMLHSYQFDLIDEICKAFKGNSNPFGGLQVVCSGDFFQLPPVQRGSKSQFIIESEIWDNMDLKICYLEDQYRQESGDLLTLLNYIRQNETNKSKQLLDAENFNNREFDTPTKLYTHNIDVDIVNNSELEKIPTKKFTYQMESNSSKPITEALKKGCLAPEVLVLKKGAKVIFVKNNFEEGYVNGTQGEVIGFNRYNLPIIKTFSGKQIIAEPVSWKIEEEGEIKAEIRQIPLRLAWAITVHKSQGMTLDVAEIDLSKSFIEGMGYVALSRLKSLDGLRLIGINDIALRVNVDILSSDERFKQISVQVMEDFSKVSSLEKEEKQKEFLDSLLSFFQETAIPRKGNLIKGPSTFQKTKSLVSLKKSIKEMAELRGVTERTILTHLEKLVSNDKEGIDIQYLGPSKICFQKIKKAFEQTGDWKLSPVRKILGNNFSYQEIELVRLRLNPSFSDNSSSTPSTKSKEPKKDSKKEKNHLCLKCDRPINYKGNYLPCNT